MARIRESFGSHENLAHIWASRSFPRGHSSDRRMFFHGGAIYSYGSHFPMAALLSGGVVLWNFEGYSTTTGKHKGITSRALSGLSLNQISVCTTHLKQMIQWARADREEAGADSIPPSKWPAKEKRKLFAEASAMHAGNAAAYLAKAERARSRADYWSGRADSELRSLEKLAGFLGYKSTDLNLAKLQKQAAAALARDAKAAREHAARAKKAKAEYLEHIKGFPAAWRNHESFILPGTERTLSVYEWERADGATLLRRSKDGLHVQTSRGAEVAWNEALKLYTFAARIKAKGEPWTPPPDIMCGPYQLRAIAANGDSTIGCHVLQYDEMQALAVREGVAI